MWCVLIDCDNLSEILKASSRLNVDPVELMSISLLTREGLGRVAISKILGYGERKVRKILEELKRGKYTHISEILGLFRKVQVESTLSCRLVFYGYFTKTILESISRYIVNFRDHIIILSRNPHSVEVIGVRIDNRVEYPRLPIEYSKPYVDALVNLQEANGVIVCWRNYRGVLDDAVLLTSLAYLCQSSIQGNK